MHLVPPIRFVATKCQMIGKYPNGIEEYWSADIKAVRHKTLTRIFTDVLFIEKPGEMVFLAGIESPDGVDRHIRLDAATKQAEFIRFLREENDRDNAALGMLSAIFAGHEYATVGKATAAYLVARKLTHAFGVGFLDGKGEYQLVKIEPSEDNESEKRRCESCGHKGDDGDSSDTESYCGSCGKTVLMPDADLCPACGAANCMMLACPKCGGLYSLDEQHDA